MEYIPVFGLMFIVIAFISWRWVCAIDYMKENHPDYKGEDFLNWGEETAPWETEKWDDDKVHTEGGL
jgi:hypothetical protein